MNVLIGFLIGVDVLSLIVVGICLGFCERINKDHLALIAALNGRSSEWRTATKKEAVVMRKAEKPAEAKDVGI